MHIGDDLNNEFASPEHAVHYRALIQTWWESLDPKPVVVVLSRPITDWGL